MEELMIIKNRSKKIFKKKYLDFVIKLIPSDCNKILDMCCGSGDFVELLSKKGYDVEGVDYNKDAIKKAKELYNNKYSQGDIRKWEPTEKKDLIIVMDAFYEFKKELRIEIINRLKQYLNPGGYFLITIPYSKRYVKPSKESPVPKYNSDIKNELTHMMPLDTYIEWSLIDWENYEDMNKGIVILKNI